jgi:hypothetical protein
MQNSSRQWIGAWRRLGRRHRLAQAMIVNWAFGMGIGVFCAALLLAFDIFGVRSLLWRSDIAFVGSAMLCAAFAFTFGGVVAAGAVMQLGDPNDTPRGGRRRRYRAPRPQPIAASARAELRRRR